MANNDNVSGLQMSKAIYDVDPLAASRVLHVPMWRDLTAKIGRNPEFVRAGSATALNGYNPKLLDQLKAGQPGFEPKGILIEETSENIIHGNIITSDLEMLESGWSSFGVCSASASDSRCSQ